MRGKHIKQLSKPLRGGARTCARETRHWRQLETAAQTPQNEAHTETCACVLSERAWIAFSRERAHRLIAMPVHCTQSRVDLKISGMKMGYWKQVETDVGECPSNQAWEIGN